MRLNELARLTGADLIGLGDIEITSIEQDSRLVTGGTLFIAVPGFTVDGHSYIARAFENGAQAIVAQADHEALWRPLVEAGGADVVVMPDTRSGMAKLAAAFHGYPARKLKVIGVTGTDGKTSLSHLIAHVLNSTGHKAGLISTAECTIGDQPLPDTGRFTTPESPAVQSMLAQMVDAGGCEWAVVEATSHGLALHRVDECEYDIAVVTNLGRDHIDFHGTDEDYRAAKGGLFEMLDRAADKGITKTAVINADDPASEYFRARTSSRILTYAINTPADFHPTLLHADSRGTQISAAAGDDRVDFRMPHPAKFNVYNALAALAVGTSAGLFASQVTSAIESWPGAPGRMELVDEGQPFRVVVDFAHAPDSLRRVLTHLRQTSSGRIIAVFGCIGERDKDRRPGMAAVAAELADYTIVTDDNPYSEDRTTIIDAIAAGLRAAGKKEGHDFAVVPDRREAISQALSMAVDEDNVLLAGKGHERTVHLAGGVYECHDPTVARDVLRSIAAGHR
ncbi:MAG TPA: UDP-N-acetylmuramoyl-L-alanyl-D-glutamate--2,6-diaminopimelate ligase [Dehalococcoidia bacterium]|nr:UDP-N-acetylmuramoyl-L-alanyl-D-glutamate--2,6-diaminopimelate ligase [Dehalococcoidia bacterium]